MQVFLYTSLRQYVMHPVLLSATLTIIGGAITFALGQMFLKALLDPIMDLKKEVGRIAYALDYFDNQRTSEAAIARFRDHACRLCELMNTLFLYDVWEPLFRLPKREHVFKASAKLIGHSNGENNKDYIKQLLLITSDDDIVRERRSRGSYEH